MIHVCRTGLKDLERMGRIVTDETYVGETGDGSNDIGALVHDDDRTRAETRLCVLEGIVIHPNRWFRI